MVEEVKLAEVKVRLKMEGAVKVELVEVVAVKVVEKWLVKVFAEEVGGVGGCGF